MKMSLSHLLPPSPFFHSSNLLRSTPIHSQNFKSLTVVKTFNGGFPFIFFFLLFSPPVHVILKTSGKSLTSPSISFQNLNRGTILLYRLAAKYLPLTSISLYPLFLKNWSVGIKLLERERERIGGYSKIRLWVEVGQRVWRKWRRGRRVEVRERE